MFTDVVWNYYVVKKKNEVNNYLRKEKIKGVVVILTYPLVCYLLLFSTLLKDLLWLKHKLIEKHGQCFHEV